MEKKKTVLKGFFNV